MFSWDCSLISMGFHWNLMGFNGFFMFLSWDFESVRGIGEIFDFDCAKLVEVRPSFQHL